MPPSTKEVWDKDIVPGTETRGLRTGVGRLFLEGPESRSFLRCRPFGLSPLFRSAGACAKAARACAKAASGGVHVHRHGFVQITLYLWRLTFTFHKSFMCPKIVFSF